MARGLWRCWVAKNGVDVWTARLEIARGDWADLTQAEYEAAGHAPPFWDLPLEADYMESLRMNPIESRIIETEMKIMPGFVILMIILGGAAAALFTAYTFFDLNR